MSPAGAGPSDATWIVGSAAAIALVSYLDDRSFVHPALRLGVHLAASAATVLGASVIPNASNLALPLALPRPLLVAILVVGMAWSINLYNFMDGMDGLAGGMTVFGFGTLAVLASFAGGPLLAGVCAALACAAAGFLTVNFPPARLFMGDVGSSTLGFFTAALTLLGVRDGVLPAAAVLITFSPFVVDATVTLARRVLRRERAWQPHRTHFYQRLVRAGWGHRRTLIAEYALMLLCSATAIVGTLAHVKWPPVLAAGVAVYLALMAGVALVERSRTRDGNRQGS